MDKQEILKKVYKPEDKLLISKMFDKIEYCKKYHKIMHTDFLDSHQQKILEKILKTHDGAYLFYGGTINTERNLLFFYPNKLDEKWIEKEITSCLNVIRISLPTMLKGQYIHKNYLGAMMKIGIKRKKVGDILVDETGADIIVEKEISNYSIGKLSELKRFQSSKIQEVPLNQLRKVEIRTKEIKIIVPSLRLDCIIAELAKTSKTKANELINDSRVFINDENEYKNTKQLKQKDKITIRGQGKFIFDFIEGKTKKNNYILNILKYI